MPSVYKAPSVLADHNSTSAQPFGGNRIKLVEKQHTRLSRARFLEDIADPADNTNIAGGIGELTQDEVDKKKSDMRKVRFERPAVR